MLLVEKIVDLAGQNCVDCRAIRELARHSSELLRSAYLDPDYVKSLARAQEEDAISARFKEIQDEAYRKAQEGRW